MRTTAASAITTPTSVARRAVEDSHGMHNKQFQVLQDLPPVLDRGARADPCATSPSVAAPSRTSMEPATHARQGIFVVYEDVQDGASMPRRRAQRGLPAGVSSVLGVLGAEVFLFLIPSAFSVSSRASWACTTVPSDSLSQGIANRN
jgi:hypothetical protein